MKPREPRLPVNVAARMHTGTDWVDVTILNMSARGLMMRASCDVGRGSYVEVRRGTLTIVARVVWSRGGYFGLRSQDRIPIEDVVNEPRLLKRPGAAPTTQPAERRGEARRALDARVKRSQNFARVFQFVAIGGAGAVAVAILAGTIGQLLMGMSATVQRAMGGG